MKLSGDLGGETTFSSPVPVVPQSTFSVTAIAVSSDFQSFSFGAKQGIAAGTSGVSLGLKPGPGLQKPDDKASDVARATGFSWTSSLQGGLNVVAVGKKLPETDAPRAAAAETPFSITVVTSESRTTIPDLSALGMALPASTDFTWGVQSVAPVTPVDSLLAGGTGNFPPGQNEFYTASSAPRAFKTAAAP